MFVASFGRRDFELFGSICNESLARPFSDNLIFTMDPFHKRKGFADSEIASMFQ